MEDRALDDSPDSSLHGDFHYPGVVEGGSPRSLTQTGAAADEPYATPANGVANMHLPIPTAPGAPTWLYFVGSCVRNIQDKC